MKLDDEKEHQGQVLAASGSGFTETGKSAKP